MHLLLLLLACTAGDDTAASDDTAALQDVVVDFHATVGAEDFDCASVFTGLGATATSYTPLDFRLYLHDFVLFDGSGAAVPLTLEPDGLWQVENLVLLDFEDKSGSCQNGTTDTNSHVHGTIPAGTYTGLGFTLGVPFSLNHGDAAAAPSPLNVSSLFWSWQLGYKFLRIDAKTTGLPDGAVFHLGSTGCSADEDGNVTGCTAENVGPIVLQGFDPATSRVRLDLAGLYQGVDLDTNNKGESICMSTPTDTDCDGLFANLGLGFGERPANPDAQRTFTIE